MKANQAKLYAWLEEMKAWRKETRCREAIEACQETAKVAWEEMNMVETSIEEVKAMNLRQIQKKKGL
jgi:hypothetical protein